MGFLELRRQCGVSHEVPRGSQGASCVAPGKSSIPFELQVRTGDCSPVTAGQNRPHLRLCPGPSVPLLGRQGSQGCILDSPGESGLVLRGKKGLHSPVPTLQGPCYPSQKWRGTLTLLPQSEIRSSSIAPVPVMSREAPLNSTVSLTSQRNPAKLPEVMGTSRGNPGFPATPRERPREFFFEAS